MNDIIFVKLVESLQNLFGEQTCDDLRKLAEHSQQIANGPSRHILHYQLDVLGTRPFLGVIDLQIIHQVIMFQLEHLGLKCFNVGMRQQREQFMRNELETVHDALILVQTPTHGPVLALTDQIPF